MNVNLKTRLDRQFIITLLLFVPGFFFGTAILLLDRFLDSFFIQQSTSFFNTSYRPFLPTIGVFSFLLMLFLCRNTFNDVINKTNDVIIVSLASGGVLGGALSNLLYYNMYGGVVDYCVVPFISAIKFNAADLTIVVGLVVLGWKMLIAETKSSKAVK